MRVGVVVDGESEYKSLRALFPQLQTATGYTFLRPVLAKFCPTAPYPAIARACQSHLLLLTGKRVDRIVVLLDREDRGDCSGPGGSGDRGSVVEDWRPWVCDRGAEGSNVRELARIGRGGAQVPTR